jgi:hypothetical protein
VSPTACSRITNWDRNDASEIGAGGDDEALGPLGIATAAGSPGGQEIEPAARAATVRNRKPHRHHAKQRDAGDHDRRIKERTENRSLADWSCDRHPCIGFRGACKPADLL